MFLITIVGNCRNIEHGNDYQELEQQIQGLEEIQLGKSDDVMEEANE